MYVCLCNNVTDRDIRKAVRSGCRRLEDLSAELGVATNCGSCADLAEELLAEADRPAMPVAGPALPQPA